MGDVMASDYDTLVADAAETRHRLERAAQAKDKAMARAQGVARALVPVPTDE